MRTITGLVVATLLSTSVTAAAQSRGSGSGRLSSTAPVTKDAGPPAEAAALPARDLPLEPRHGFFGAPGAAGDQDGPSRLGRHGDRATAPSYGEAARQVAAGGEVSDAWRSGDRVRSLSSADVRAARQQQAPDLEWASAGGTSGAAQRSQLPYGMKYQEDQQKPKR
jgi:hypothetical protein